MNKETLEDLFIRLTKEEQEMVLKVAYLIDDLKGARKEIERLNNLLEDIKTYLKGYDYDKLTDREKVLVTDISLLIAGRIKLVKEEKDGKINR